MPFSRLVPRLAGYCVAAAILFWGVVISLERGRVKDLDDYKNPRYTTGRASLAEYLKEFESAFEADLCPDLIPRSYSALLGESPDSRCMRLKFEVPVFDGIAFVDFRTWFDTGFVSGGTIHFLGDDGEHWVLQVQNLGDKAFVSATERIPRNMIDKFQCETLDYVILKSHFKHDLFTLQTLYELDREASQRGAFELDLVRSIIKQVLASSLFEIPERFRAFEKREIENGWAPSDST